MKKLAFLIAAVSLLMAGCNDDFEDELNELRDKVNNLENAQVSGLEFQGNNLVILFSNGTTTQVTVPEGILPGNVTDFDIDNESGIIAVTFADGTTKEYIVLTNGNTTYLSGTLEGDYGITSITLGDVEMVNLDYDGQDRVVKVMVNIPDGNGNVVNVMELQHNYAATDPTIMAIEKSLRYSIDFTNEEYLSYTYAYFDADHGYHFAEEDGEMYSLYRWRQLIDTQYRYHHNQHCWFVANDDINYNTYEKYYPVPGEDSLFYKSNNNYLSMDIDGVYGRMYIPDRIVRIDKIYQPGEAMDTATIKLTMRNDDLIEKMEFLHWETGEVTGYTEMTYNQDALLTQVNMFDIKETETDYDTINFGRLLMDYTGELLTLIQFESLDDEGNVDETYDITKFVYDEVGNPVEIWAVPYYNAGDGYIYSVDAGGKIIIEEIEMVLQKVVGIEYNYTLPNFFGKTLEYMIPELKGIQVKNAPVRFTHSGFFNFVNMEYFNFNQGGYPGKVKVDAYLPELAGPALIGTELLIDYVLFD